VDHPGWAIAAYVLAIVIAHYPIAKIVSTLYRDLGVEIHAPNSHLPALVGAIERGLFVGALQLERGEFIAVWLALKVAAQWKGWEQGLGAGSAKVQGRDLFNVFLIGSGLSIALSAVSVRLAEFARWNNWRMFWISLGAACLGPP
jgi:hypothetical protein